MIRKLFATVHSVRQAPPGRLNPVIAAALFVIGSQMLARYVDYQRTLLAAHAEELGAIVAHITAIRADLGTGTPTPADLYPAPQDIDPLDRAEPGWGGVLPTVVATLTGNVIPVDDRMRTPMAHRTQADES